MNDTVLYPDNKLMFDMLYQQLPTDLSENENIN